MRTLPIGKNEAGQRMDKYLKKYFREAGSGFLYKMLRKKNILLNGSRAEGKEQLKEGDQITLYLAEETIEKFRGKEKKNIDFPVIPLEIIYEDREVLLLNKPAGMLSQKASGGNVSLVEYLTGYLLSQGHVTPKELETFQPSVCNRLDRNTSGLILAGKTLAGLQELSRMLKERSMKKYYLCLVKGNVEKKVRCKAYLEKDGRTNQVRICQKETPGASLIETGYEPLARYGDATLLKVELITGKSHQIRSHLSSLGHPLAGDPKYGNAKWNQELKRETGLSRQFLHSWEAVFPETEGVLEGISGKTFQALLPEDLIRVLEWEKREING